MIPKIMYVTATKFTAKYEGPALQTHTIDVRILGPALISYGELNAGIHRLCDSYAQPAPVVKIATFAPGSFNIELLVEAAELTDSAVNLLTTQRATALATLCTLTGYPVIKLFHKLIHLVAKKKQGANTAELRQELQHAGISIQGSNNLILLTNDKQIQNALTGIVGPLLNDGVDEMELSDSQSTVKIDKETAYILAAKEPEKEPEIRVENHIVTIATPQIEKPLKRHWKLHSNTLGEISAPLLDPDFAHQVANGMTFSKGKQFEAKLRIEKRQDDEGNTKTTYEIVELKEHPEPQQLVLPPYKE